MFLELLCSKKYSFSLNVFLQKFLWRNRSSFSIMLSIVKNSYTIYQDGLRWGEVPFNISFQFLQLLKTKTTSFFKVKLQATPVDNGNTNELITVLDKITDAVIIAKITNVSSNFIIVVDAFYIPNIIFCYTIFVFKIGNSFTDYIYQKFIFFLLNFKQQIYYRWWLYFSCTPLCIKKLIFLWNWKKFFIYWKRYSCVVHFYLYHKSSLYKVRIIGLKVLLDKT